MPAEAFSSLKLCYIVNPTHFLEPDVNYKGHPIWALNRTTYLDCMRSLKKLDLNSARQYMIIYVKKGVTYANIYVPIQKNPLLLFLHQFRVCRARNRRQNDDMENK